LSDFNEIYVFSTILEKYSK